MNFWKVKRDYEFGKTDFKMYFIVGNNAQVNESATNRND